MSGDDLPGFLLARIAEIEQVARAAVVSVAHVDLGPVSVDGAPEYTRTVQRTRWAERDMGGVIARREAVVETGSRSVVIRVSCGVGDDPSARDVAWHLANHDPTRVLAGCEAKRRIVEEWWAVRHLYAQAAFDRNGIGLDQADGMHQALYDAMAHLAGEFGDHPDYRQEWKP